MESKWESIENVPFVDGWYATRSQALSEDGVHALVSLTMRNAHNDKLMTVVMPVEVAMRMGWDLIGESQNFFVDGMSCGSLDAPDDDDDDDA